MFPRNVLSSLQSGSVGVFSTLKVAARFCEMLVSVYRNPQPHIVKEMAPKFLEDVCIPDIKYKNMHNWKRCYSKKSCI